MNVCVITDNAQSYQKFWRLVQAECYKAHIFHFYCSPQSISLLSPLEDSGIEPIELKEKTDTFFTSYDLFISLHSKQIFPKELVRNHCCINVHPGYNPYNRGWYPQVFSILNGKPVGVTIHRMDDQLDHGPVLFQEKVDVYETDTSYDVYQRIQAKETELLKNHLPQILTGEYMEYPMSGDGCIHYKRDFEKLCRIDLDEQATYRDMIDRLRATTFSGYKNAYFVSESGEKIYINIELTK